MLASGLSIVSRNPLVTSASILYQQICLQHWHINFAVKRCMSCSDLAGAAPTLRVAVLIWVRSVYVV